MQLTRCLAGWATFVLLILVVPRNARACSCGSAGPPCQNAFQADAVFAGVVKDISEAPREFDPPFRKLRVDFAVETAFRGLQGDKVTVLTADSGASCGYGFKQGERYLVYAYRSADKSRLEVSICSRTRLLAEAAEDLQFLRQLPALAAGARVSGAITHREPDLATGQGQEFGPVPDVLITARGSAGAFEAWTNGQGRYAMTGLPVGTYEITAFPPAGFSARYLQQRVELRDARACFVADFGIRYDGRITGTVKPSSGQSAEGAQIELMPSERLQTGGNIETLRTKADAGGRFEFMEVPPGLYVVGVDLTRRMDSTLVFPTTFYAGTPDPALAAVVPMAGGNRIELEPMTLPPARRTFELTGTVTFEDGTPAPNAFISLWDGTATWRQVAVGIKPQSDGTFSFIVHEGLSYVAGASYSDPSETPQRRFTTRVGPFVVSEQTGPLKVVLLPQR